MSCVCAYYSTRTTRASATLQRVRHLLVLCLCAALAGSAGCGSGKDEPRSAAPSAAEATEALAGAPAPLAAIHGQSNELLDGGPKAFEARLAALKGYPVVVNKWGSWCPPCRAEFPSFQSQAIKRGKKVAFLGINGTDNKANAAEFLKKFPVAFPSYSDPKEKVASVAKAAGPYPQTAFYDRTGEVTHVKAGPYRDEDELAADIERYAR